MFKSITLLSALLAVTSASPLKRQSGNAVVYNNCGFDVSLYSVGSNVDGPYTVSASGGAYYEPYRVDPSTGGIALKVVLLSTELLLFY
jgi:hypothetical protein